MNETNEPIQYSLIIKGNFNKSLLETMIHDELPEAKILEFKSAFEGRDTIAIIECNSNETIALNQWFTRHTETPFPNGALLLWSVFDVKERIAYYSPSQVATMGTMVSAFNENSKQFTLNLSEGILWRINLYLEHQHALTQAATDKQSRQELEECRSYAVEIVNAILNENPELRKEITK